MTKKREIATFQELDGTCKQVMLPEGCRALDFDQVNEDDEKVLNEISMNGRRSRHFFAKANLSSAVRRMKSRKMVEAIRYVGKVYQNELAVGLREIGYELEDPPIAIPSFPFWRIYPPNMLKPSICTPSKFIPSRPFSSN